MAEKIPLDPAGPVAPVLPAGMPSVKVRSPDAGVKLTEAVGLAPADKADADALAVNTLPVVASGSPVEVKPNILSALEDAVGIVVLSAGSSDKGTFKDWSEIPELACTICVNLSSAPSKTSGCTPPKFAKSTSCVLGTFLVKVINCPAAGAVVKVTFPPPASPTPDTV